MKRNITLAFLFCFLAGITQAQIYVKQDATGANDGSSWENAYTDLSEALSSSTVNAQIWVAAGTYKPAVVDTFFNDAFFTFPHDLELYGGFAGVEMMLSERDAATNETILSGDHNGDDIDDNFDDNKSDNSRHVMWLTDTVTVASIVDGFTFRNGNTEPATGTGDNRRGGGLLTYGAINIKNCRFTQNYGYFGGGLYPRDGVTPTIIENCVFENNSARFGAGMYINTDTASILDCIFENNTAEFGAGSYVGTDTATITNCVYKNNISESRGGGLYNTSDDGATITNCTFTGNESTTSRGGGVYNIESPSNYIDCTFDDNKALDSSGGGLQIRNDEITPFIEVNVTDCTFTGNDAEFGGGLGNYDEYSITNLNNCTFTKNTAIVVGGGMSNAFGAGIVIMDCTFNENEARTGGGIFSQNDSARVDIINSTIIINNASQTGGGIAISGDDEPGTLLPLPQVNITNSFVSFNTSIDQGGGLNVANANINITNSLFDMNSVITAIEGIGGAMSINTNDSIFSTYNILNTTITNNFAAIGAGIANWRQPGSTSAPADVILQNTILVNTAGDNYALEDGEPSIISNGGNFSHDNSMIDILNNANDLNNDDPLFVDYDNSDYNLMNDSPCVDSGIADGAPATDIEGNTRVDAVDMGAYENQKLVNIEELNKYFGQLDIFPNPVDDRLNFSFESNWKGTLIISVTAADGKTIISRQIEKNNDIFATNFNVEGLPKGMYNLSVSNGILTNTKSFVK